ncbi:MAG: MMPL family transporter [Chitinophagaceae bacterium]
MRKGLVWGLFFGFIVLFLVFALQLRYENDLQKIIPHRKDKQDIQSLLTSNKSLEKIIFSVSLQDSSSQDPEALMDYASQFSDYILSIDKKKLIKKIQLQQDENEFQKLVSAIQDNLPLLLNESDYIKIDSLWINSKIENRLQQTYQTLLSPGGVALKEALSNDPLGLSFPAIERLQQLQFDKQTTLYDGFIFDDQLRYLTFFIETTHPISDTKNNKSLEQLFETTIHKLNISEENKNITCHYFGGQLVASGNAIQMQKDTIITLSITIFLLLLLFYYYFRSLTTPLFVLIPLSFGALFGLAVMFVFKGQVSLMALGASSAILGIAVNYSLHFLSHLKHTHSIEKTISDLCKPMTIGSFTTISAFLGLLFMHTPVLQELGLLTAGNLIGAIIATLIFLPHFISNRLLHQLDKNNNTWIEKIANTALHEKKGFMLFLFLGIITLLFLYPKFNLMTT